MVGDFLKKRMLLLGIIILVFVIVIVKDTRAIDSNDLKLNIIFNYSPDNKELKDNALNFIDLIDDSIFETFKYDNYSTLNRNYEFLTDFTISFILKNEDFYQNNIKTLEEFQYVTDYGKQYNTDQYIPLNLIYDITDKIFGIRDYTITNKYLNIKDNMVPLLRINNISSKMKIEKIIDLKQVDDYYNFYVKYEELDYTYIYKFKLLEDRLILINLDIEV